MTKKDQASGVGAPPETSAAASALGAVSALMEERRRFESWLSALEARRETTPPRVFTRVHADYTARLEAVVTQLTSHSDALESELGRVTEQLESANDEQQQARDERAEAELRAHVGELSAEEWEQTAQAADERIDMLVSRHADLETELLRTRELLAEARRPATPRVASAAIPAVAKLPDPTVEASVSASVSAAAASPIPAAMDAVSDSAEAAMHVPSAAAGAAPSGAESNATPAESPPQETSAAVIAAEAELLEGPPRGQPPRKRASTSAFDELAFLNSVVDTPSPAAEGPQSPRRDSTPMRQAEGAIENRDATADTSILGTGSKKGTPLAANITGNNPIILREKAGESARTLKCSDCGAMNYPTEWYCERCGAELASL